MGWIYKITNQINGKVYIGKTELANPEKRWGEHKSDFKRQRYEKRPLYSAMKKYGVENFKFEVIDSDENSSQLCELECYYIDKYRSYVGYPDCNGYNATLGGDGKPYLGLDDKEVIKVHIKNEYMVCKTAKIFNCDYGTIKNIMLRNNIKCVTRQEYIRNDFLKKYGGIVKLDKNCLAVVEMYDTPYDVLKANDRYNEKTFRLALAVSHKTHHAYGYTWYRLNELPDKYKPLLEEYCKTHTNENQENDYEELLHEDV